MRTQAVVKLMPSLLATCLIALACESPPNPVAAKRPSFAVQDPGTDRITGGGKLGDGRDFATFAFHASTVTRYGATEDDPAHCRAWSGEGEAKFKDPGTASTGPFLVKACDYGEPGRGTDTICFMFDIYVRGDNVLSSDILTAGNIQLHPGAPGIAA